MATVPVSSSMTREESSDSALHLRQIFLAFEAGADLAVAAN